jgi:hypothetical protein
MSKQRFEGKVVYLSGPITGVENYNRDAFADAKRAVLEGGAEYVHDPSVESCGGRPHEWWMRRALSELTQEGMDANGNPFYGCVAMLPGWERSDGAKVERMCAEACGIEVVEL